MSTDKDIWWIPPEPPKTLINTGQVIRKTRTVTIDYWCCGITGCHTCHRSEIAALECHNRHENPAGKRKDLTERNLEIIKFWILNQNYRIVSEKFNLSQPRIIEIVNRYFKYVFKSLKENKLQPQPKGSYKLIVTPEMALQISESKLYKSYFQRKAYWDRSYAEYPEMRVKDREAMIKTWKRSKN